MNKLLIATVLMFSNAAFASVVVHDNAGVIPIVQRSALVSSESRWPFDLHILTGIFQSKEALNQATHHCITGPNIVCIGIDPVHHTTNVHFGTAVGIASSDFSSISSAGNIFFKNGDYQGGVEAIATRTRGLANSIHNNERIVVQTPVQIHVDSLQASSQGVGTGWWVFGFLLFAVVGVCVWVIFRAKKTVKKINDDMNDFRDEAFEMSSRNMEERDWHEKMKTKQAPEKHVMMPVTAPTPMPVSAPTSVSTGSTTIVHNNISSPAAYGSSANDMLLGYELGRLSNPAPVVIVPTSHEVVREIIPSSDNGGSSSNWDTNSNNDSGGSSSWDDNDSSSSSSSDSSSNWDSGGSDSGSGSSDW